MKKLLLGSTALAVGGLVAAPAMAGDPIKIFFLICVAVAGLYGTWTVGRRILFVQTVPAVIALIAVWFT